MGCSKMHSACRGYFVTAADVSGMHVKGAGARAVRGVGRKNADVELAQLADMLPAEDHSTNAAAPSLEKGGASTAPDPAAARASVEPPEQTEASSPGAPPAAALRRQDRSDSPKLQRLVSHPQSALSGRELNTSIGRYAGFRPKSAVCWIVFQGAGGHHGQLSHFSSRPAPALRLWCCSGLSGVVPSVQAGVITRSQHSRAQQEGCPEALLGGFSPPMRRRAASNEGDSQQQGSTLSDRASKTAGVLSCRTCACAQTCRSCVVACCSLHGVLRCQSCGPQACSCIYVQGRCVLLLRWLTGWYNGSLLCRRVRLTPARIMRQQRGIAEAALHPE